MKPLRVESRSGDGLLQSFKINHSALTSGGRLATKFESIR